MAAGALVTIGVATAEADTAPASVICTVSDRTACAPLLGRAGSAGPQPLQIEDAPAAIRLFGPGGLLIGDGLDALARDPSCTAGCLGGNGGLLWGNGGAARSAAQAATRVSSALEAPAAPACSDTTDGQGR
ncbi:hypothetical protein H7I76_29365 [Mycolicibacterium vaccae]|nr:hypothetical protein [Mycolicibacterium vaccae]